MARVRLLDPGFFTNEQLVELPFEYRLLFAGLWTLADREGRLEDRPKRIRMALFPCDNVDCDAGIQALHDAGLVLRYSVEGVAYIAILAFAKHQKPHPRETSSVIPAPEGQPKVSPRQTQGEPEADQGSAKARGLSDSRTLGNTHTPRATAADLAVAMRKAGVEANSAHPAVIALAEQGVTVETAVAACEEAVRRKPGERLPVGYVAKVLESWAQQAAETRANGAQAPPPRASPRTPTKAESFVAKLSGSHLQEPIDVIEPVTAAPRTRLLGA